MKLNIPVLAFNNHPIPPHLKYFISFFGTFPGHSDAGYGLNTINAYSEMVLISDIKNQFKEKFGLNIDNTQASIHTHLHSCIGNASGYFRKKTTTHVSIFAFSGKGLNSLRDLTLVRLFTNLDDLILYQKSLLPQE